MTRSLYPIVNSQDDVIDALKEIVRVRQEEDIPDFTNLNQEYVLGRVTQRVPSSATDVLPEDNIGDRVNDSTHKYQLFDISGVIKWGRVAIDTTW